MVGSGGRPAAFNGYASADVVACAQASILFRVSRLREGDIALKVFRRDANPQGQAFAREWMLGDWRVWSRLAHPHVLPVSDFGEREGSLFVATPWVDGPSLRAVLEQRRTLDPAQVRQLAMQLASALDAAAASGLIHLDVKPENVLFAAGERELHAWVTDFGAGSLAARRAAADPSAPFRGTLEYAAPEQIDGSGVDGRTMVYSLGCLLYETLTGATPSAARSHEGLVPPAAGRVFAQALAQRRDERYASCTDFAAALCEQLPAPDPAEEAARRRFVSLRRLTVAASVALVISASATAASWLGAAAPGTPDAAAHEHGASPAFLAALPAGEATVKIAGKPVRAKRPSPRKAPATKTASHDHAPTVASEGVSDSAIRTPKTQPPEIKPSNVARQAPAPAASRGSTGGASPPPETTTPAAAAPSLPPPPPSQDPTPPLPPPPP